MERRKALRLLGLGALIGPSLLTAKQPSAKPVSAAVRVCYSPAYVGAAHAFETTRKAAWVADSLKARPIPGIGLVANLPLALPQLQRAHDADYIRAVRTGEPRPLAQSQGFAWDPQLWPMVLASNGGVVAAAHRAMTEGVAGALSSGLHHARRDQGRGFCTFNGLAIAAMDLRARGVRRILVIDLDAHCGGGTHSLIGALPGVHQLDIAVDGFDHYSTIGANTLDLVTQAERYLPTLDARLAELVKQPFDLCLYNAGMDPHEGCAVGGLPGVDAKLLQARERRVFDWCARKRLPVAFVLAGGYLGPQLDRGALVDLHRFTLQAAAQSLVQRAKA
jgi:acetoin utilization deacetylase AcuC-like enzyme